jgi:membrane protein DedA with SNARE-associated domain
MRIVAGGDDQLTVEPRLVDRVPLWWILVPLVITTGATFVADVVWPLLAHTHPLLLMLISSRGRHLILVAPFVSLVPFVAVALTRLMIGDLLAFALGRRYGDRGIEYLLRRAGRRAHHVERAVTITRRASPAVVLLLSGNAMCIAVAATGMRLRRFVILDTIGTAFGVTMTWFIGDAFSSPITAGLDWVAEHPWPVTGGMVVLVGAALVVRQRRRGASGGIREALEELEEIDRAAHATLRPTPEG